LEEYSKGLRNIELIKKIEIIKKILLGAAKALKEFHECGKNLFFNC
jgi:hypothetical protein